MFGTNISKVQVELDSPEPVRTLCEYVPIIRHGTSVVLSVSGSCRMFINLVFRKTILWRLEERKDAIKISLSLFRPSLSPAHPATPLHGIYAYIAP